MLAVSLALLIVAASDETPDASVDVPLADGGVQAVHEGDQPLPLPLFLALDGGVVEFFPSDAGAGQLEPKWITIKGNRVLPEEVYRNWLVLPEGAKPDTATATYIEDALHAFLVQSGYELATVAAFAKEEHIIVNIDEGQLEKVVFAGRLTAQTLRYRLELFIDQDVFNRPALERQIAALSERIGLRVVRWALVPTANPEHMGPQITDAPAIEGLVFLHPRKRYELWFYFQENEWDSGAGIDLRSGYIDGLEIGLNYQGVGLFNDRWRVATSGGVGVRDAIGRASYYAAFSRAFAEGRWYSPKLGNTRASVWLQGTLTARQRPDLGVENYNEADTIASVHLEFELGKSARLAPGIGGTWSRIFNLSPGEGVNPDTLPGIQGRIRYFAELQAEWTVDPDNQRWDRQHQLQAGIRYYAGRAIEAPEKGVLSYGYLYGRYRKVLEFGWHDLWIKATTRVAAGDVVFHDEQSLGEYLRGLYGDTFVRKAGNLTTEFRFSLSRDVLKLSFFTEIAGWGEVNRATDNELFRFGVAAGPGFHALVQGMFQIDIYGSFGVQTGPLSMTGQHWPVRFGYGLVAFLNKVF